MKNETKRVIYNKYFEEDDIYDMEAFYEVVDKKLVYICGWSLNDANYRDEYMSRLFSYLGVSVETLPKKYNKQALALIKEAFGL